MFLDTRYLFNFLRGSGLEAEASSLVVETRLPVSGLRKVSSSHRLDDISRLLYSVSRPSEEISLLALDCALDRSVSSL